MITDIKELDLEEKIRAQDFGFFVDDFTEQYTGIPGTTYVCADLLYEDDLGPRIRIYPHIVQYPIEINPHFMIVVFFDDLGNITCDVDIINLDEVITFVSGNLSALLSFWKREGTYDSISLWNDIKLWRGLNEAY